MEHTILALLPPAVAVILALATKEVLIPLFISVLTGALLLTNFNILNALKTTIEIMGTRIGENINILLFLVFLGITVSLITKSGADRAYGNWAIMAIKTKRGALFGTAALGALIFVDDYFNCLTVGSVMRPITDRYKISRAKLAYIIDSTAAPVCIISPISSWAAAVGSSLPAASGIDGIKLFIDAIPFNYYALTALATVILIIMLNFDFSAMKKALNTTNKSSGKENACATVNSKVNERARVYDLILPISTLIGLCVCFMLYTGGFFSGNGAVQALNQCDAPLSLALGSLCTLFVIFFLYIPRRIVTFKAFAKCIVSGFKSMAPAILILTLAWTLSGVCGAKYLDAGGFVGRLIGQNTVTHALLPPLLFLAALGLAFATGTSWGTFGILIPIAIAAFENTGTNFLTIAVAAVLAGAVCGDHISPISDTTILASTGAGCDHLEHVKTQMPYAIMAAVCSIVGFTIAGLTQNGYTGLSTSFALLFLFIFTAYKHSKKQYFKK